MQDAIDILLVDDEERNLETLAAILDDPSYRLLRARDADQALRLLLEHDVAVIVLDIKMPGVSGFELAQLIKGTKKFRQIPIVFLTAYLLDDRDIVAGYGAGAVDYLTKPLNPQILRHKVAVLAELFRKTRALAALNEKLELRVQERTAALEQSEAALRRAADQKDLFLATLAHELRNPLAPLRTGLDLLLRDSDDGGKHQPTLQAMNRQLIHMVRLIDDLLDVSRITLGTVEIKKQRVGVATMVEHGIEIARPALARRQQAIVFEEAPSLEIEADPTRIAQIVSNLLDNASKHSPPGASIHLRVVRSGDCLELVVTDSGVGIPAEQLEQVFAMFTSIRRNGAEATQGLGIGLALSRRLAELHGGTLTAASEGEGKGARFVLSIPIAAPLAAGSVETLQAETRHAEARPAGTRREGATTVSSSTAPKPRLQVVVVDDNVDSAEMLSDWLAFQGHEVGVAHTGPEGLALITSSRPDVVLCDIGLPGMDGVEVCRTVVQAMPEPPVMIALTGWGAQSDRQRTADAGFRHHLVKPVDLDKLVELLAAISSRAA